MQIYSNMIYIFGFEPKFICRLMYTCEKSSTPHELSYFGIFKFYHLKFSCVKSIYYENSFNMMDLG